MISGVVKAGVARAAGSAAGSRAVGSDDRLDLRGQIPAADPVDDQRCVLLGRFLPHEVAGVENVESAVGQSLMEGLSISYRDKRVPAARDDLNGRVDLRESIAENGELMRIDEDIKSKNSKHED